MKGCIVKATQNTPDWAVSLVEQVCKDYNRAKPADLVWHNSKHVKSGGVTYYAKTMSGKQMLKRTKTGRLVVFRGKIRLSAGTDEIDQKLVLLHELAHWIVVRGKATGHTVRFWKQAFELYERYGIDLEYAHSREKYYRKTATSVYEKAFKK